MILVALLTGCGGAASPADAGVVSADSGTEPQTAAAAAAANQDASNSYLLLNQRLIEGVSTTTLDLDDAEAVFWHVYTKLPDEVIVYPSENYFYFILYVDRKQIWGNLRLPAGKRDRGVLSFAYFEYKESPYVTEPRVRKSKMFTPTNMSGSSETNSSWTSSSSLRIQVKYLPSLL